MIYPATIKFHVQAMRAFPIESNSLKHPFLNISLPLLPSPEGGGFQRLVGLVQQHMFDTQSLKAGNPKRRLKVLFHESPSRG